MKKRKPLGIAILAFLALAKSAYAADLEGPIAKTTAALKGAARVGICFNEPVNKASAETISNYIIPGVQVTAAKLQESGNKVALTVSAPITSAFSLNIKNVTDTVGNKMAVTDLAGSVINMIAADIGTPGEDPLIPGSTLVCSPGDFEVTGGGSDIWSDHDGFHYVYEQKTGDFDVKARIVSLSAIAHVSSGSIMVREDLDIDSRNWLVKTTPYNQPTLANPDDKGAGVYRTTSRKDKGGSTGIVQDGKGPPRYPNVWVRLNRTGNTFTSYQSEDGVIWKIIASEIPPNGDEPPTPTPYPATVYLGLGANAQINRDDPAFATTVVFENYRAHAPGPIAMTTAALKGATRVGVCFNEPVNKASAETIGNYTIPGVQVTAATLQESGNKVALTVSAPITAAFNLNIKNVTDTVGNKMAVTDLAGSVINMIATDIGTPGEDPLILGSTLVCSPGDFEVTGGGSDIWSDHDGFHYVYEQRTGDFDVKARIVSLSAIANVSSGSIMVREDLDLDSRNWLVKTTPYNQPTLANPDDKGAGVYRTTSRKVKGGSTGIVKDGDGPPLYPHVWIRLKRTGNTFTSYQSEDGITWKEIVSEIPPNEDDPPTPTPYPATVYLGLGANAQINSDDPAFVTTVVFENYGDMAAPRPSLSHSRSGNQLTLSWSPAGGRLQMNANVADPTSWTFVGPINPAVITITNGNRFFRVINP